MHLLSALLFSLCTTISPTLPDSGSVEFAVNDFFQQYVPADSRLAGKLRADSFKIDSLSHIVRIYCNESFSSQSFSDNLVGQIKNTLRQKLPSNLSGYQIELHSNKGYLIDELVPFSALNENQTGSRLWPAKMDEPTAWVTNISRTNAPRQGLSGRHLFIWPSHGRYFDGIRWKWQRPSLYSTTEDLLTQSIVYPFLFPMLENAGAIVYSPRERDTQTSEAIVDNNTPDVNGQYKEESERSHAWHTLRNRTGFQLPDSVLAPNSFPFEDGTVRWTRTTTDSLPNTLATYTPTIPRAGYYAVYISYATTARSVSDAHYSIHHAGGVTDFRVNQQIGGSTWVYLGTFYFNAGQTDKGFVVISNESREEGIITTDAVRFGGGMGIVARGDGTTSGFPRFLEAARYQAQWCGVPDSLFNEYKGGNDYNDDLRVRGNMVNWLGGGSCYQPNATGKGVPFELALAIHSDAGVLQRDQFFGTLSICTTQPPADSLGVGESGTYLSGRSRLASRDLADVIKHGIVSDLERLGYAWPARETWDRNYAETRMPNIPTAIIETLSHQNFRDMTLAHEPLFKFHIARSIYKSILRYVYASHGWEEPVVQPLPVNRFSAILNARGDSVRLSWQPTIDSLEASAFPTGYLVYCSRDPYGRAFDNGQSTNGLTEITLPINPGEQLSYRVSAWNNGGESFPSATLSVYRSAAPIGNVLLVDAFDMLSGPTIVETPDSAGVDLNDNPGVPYQSSWAFSGQQTKYSEPRADINSTLDFTGDEFRGNYQNQSAIHCNAIATDGRFNVSAATVDVAPALSWKPYQVVDYFAGLNHETTRMGGQFKAFPYNAQVKLQNFATQGGHLIVSGAAVGSDMPLTEEKEFLRQTLSCQHDGTISWADDLLIGLNTQFLFHNHTAVDFPKLPRVDKLQPASSQAFTFITYSNGHSAGIAARNNKSHTLTMGFPFEAIDSTQRSDFMHALLNFLLF